MDVTREYRGRGRGAFPSDLERDVDVALTSLPHAELSPSSVDIGTLWFRGEPLRIPARIYNPASDLKRATGCSSRQRDILACWYTRHHDGFVRQRCISAVLPSQEPWVVPFVVQMLGEYVVEVTLDLYRELPKLMARPYLAFVAENPQYVALTRQRALSYWDCYYRRAYPDRDTYPPLRILAALMQASADAGRQGEART